MGKKKIVIILLMLTIATSLSGCISDSPPSDNTANIGHVTVVFDSDVILTLAGRVIWYENISSDNKWVFLDDNCTIPLNENIYIYQYMIAKPGGIILWARMQITKPDGIIMWGDYDFEGSHVGEYVTNQGPMFSFQADQPGTYDAIIYLGVEGSFPQI